MSQRDATSPAPRPDGASHGLHPDDVRRAAALSRDALIPFADADWSRPAYGLEWSRWRTLQHMTSAVQWYGMCLAMPSEEPFRLRLLPQPVYSADHPLPLLLAMLERQAAVLSIVAAASDPSARGFHAFGYPDPIGYIAMGCTEILLHTEDIVLSFGQELRPPDDLCRGAVSRLFPWAPTDEPPWSTLRWATGRESLPGRPDTPPNWAWHASPIAEWDGEVKTRESYAGA